MGYPGYPQQNWQQQPGRYYPPGRPLVDGGSASLAVMGGIVGIGVAGLLATQTFLLLSDLEQVPELPGGWTAMVVFHFVVAGLALLGAVLVFARQVTGAFVLMVSALLTVAVLLLIDPAMAEGVWASMLGALPEFVPTSDFGGYFQALLEFGNEQAVLRLMALALGVILLVIAVLPPSLKWLRRSGEQGYSGYPQGW
jgi:hypothetical protein